METPILDAIRQFRENRPQRVEARRERIRDLLTPFSSDSEGAAPAAAPEPASRIGKFLRSLGAGSSRQDLMPLRKSIMMPDARSPQTYANGPDTGADAGKRAYDGDGNLPDNPAMVLPNPAIQGGTDTLPPVPVMPLPSPSTAAPTAESLTAQANQMVRALGKMVDPSPAGKAQRVALEKELTFTLAERDRLLYLQENKSDQERLAESIAAERKYQLDQKALETTANETRATNAETNRFNNEKALDEAKREAESLPGVMKQAQNAALEAYETTNWQAFDAGILSSNLVKRDMNKLPLPGEDGRGLSRAPIARKAAAVLQQYGGLAGLPPEETLKLSAALAYAYPVVPDAKGKVNAVAEIARIQQQMNQNMNLTNDMKMYGYLGDLAHMLVYNAVGRSKIPAPAPAPPPPVAPYSFGN